MKKTKSQKKRTISKGGIIAPSLFGAVSAILILICLLLVFSAVSLLCDTPSSLVPPLSYFAIFSASFFGGFIAIKKNKGRDAMLCGALCGTFTALSLSLIFLAIGFFLSTKSSAAAWLFRIAIIPSSIFGGIIASLLENLPDSRASKLKKMRKSSRR